MAEFASHHCMNACYNFIFLLILILFCHFFFCISFNPLLTLLGLIKAFSMFIHLPWQFNYKEIIFVLNQYGFLWHALLKVKKYNEIKRKLELKSICLIYKSVCLTGHAVYWHNGDIQKAKVWKYTFNHSFIISFMNILKNPDVWLEIKKWIA